MSVGTLNAGAALGSQSCSRRTLFWPMGSLGAFLAAEMISFFFSFGPVAAELKLIFWACEIISVNERLLPDLLEGAMGVSIIKVQGGSTFWGTFKCDDMTEQAKSLLRTWWVCLDLVSSCGMLVTIGISGTMWEHDCACAYDAVHKWG